MIGISRPPGAPLAPGTLAGNATDANTSTVYLFDSNGTRTQGSTGIQTFEVGINNANPPAAVNVLTSSGFALSGIQGLEFVSLAYWNNTQGGDRALYGVANRGAFNGSSYGGNPLTIGVGPAQNGRNLIYLLDPDTGAGISPFRNSAGRANMPGGLESVSPSNGNLGGSAANGRPWAGTNVIAQTQIPTLGNVTAIATNDNNQLIAVTDLGEVYTVNITTTGNSRRDLSTTPVLTGVTLRTVNPITAVPTNIIGGGVYLEQLTQGPTNYVDASGLNVPNLFFGVTNTVVCMRST